MRKLIAIAIAGLVSCGVAMAALDVYDTVTVKTVSTLKLATGTQTNAAVDLAGAQKGICNFIIFISAATTNDATFAATGTLYHATAIGGTYYPVTNGAGSVVRGTCTGYAGTGTVTSVKVESEKLNRYLKLYTTVAGAGDTCDIGAVLLYSK